MATVPAASTLPELQMSLPPATQVQQIRVWQALLPTHLAAQECQGLRCGRQQGRARGREGKRHFGEAVQDLERKMKRQRTNVSTTEANEKMPANVGHLDLADHRHHATRWWNRFQVQLGSLEDAPAPCMGKYGYADHARLGLIGCLA